MDSDTSDPASDLESEKDGAKSSQKVLIEKGGKFEFVNASDMEAVGPVIVDEEDKPHSGQTDLEEGAVKADQQVAMDKQESKGESHTIVDLKNCSSANTLSSSHEDTKHPTSKDNENSNNPAKNNVHILTARQRPLKATSQVRIVEATENKGTVASPQRAKTTRDKFLTPTGSTASMRQFTNRQTRRKPAIERTKSAPGGRVSTLLDQDEDEKQKRQRNEVAFTAWLSKKKEEDSRQQKLARTQPKFTEDDLEQKRLRNEATFNTWITAKDRELQAKRAQEKPQRPATSIPKADGTAAYASWVERKNQQRKKEAQFEQHKHRQVEETANKSDTSVIDKSYKDWLHKKNAQAKEDAVKKEQYKRIYFSQSKKLKQSLTSRFEGF